MKIIVPIKRVVDYNVKVRPLSDQSDVDLNNVKMAMNPFCEIAIEEAVRLKEAGTATEVIAVTVGKSDSQEQLRTALALGADRAILVETDSPFLSPVPHRGKTNEPGRARFVADLLARLHNLSINEVAQITTTNAKAIFNFS